MKRNIWMVCVCLLLLLPLCSVFLSGHGAAASDSDLWTVRCNDTEEGSQDSQKDCEIFQRLVVKETGERVVEFAIGFPPETENARGVIVLPLGIILPQGVIMVIDEDEARYKFDVRYCVRQGCFAFVDMTDKILNEFKMGGEVTLSFVAMNGKPLSVKMSLTGITKALKKASPS